MNNYPQELLNNIESACINYMPKDIYNKYLVEQFDKLRNELGFKKIEDVKEEYEIEIDHVEMNKNNAVAYWNSNKGFGCTSIYWDENNNFSIDDEAMGYYFCRQVFLRVVDYILARIKEKQ